MRILVGLACAAFVIVAAPASAQVIFAPTCPASAYPNCGWQSAASTTSNWTRAHRPGSGPQGQDAVEVRQISNTSGPDYGGQFTWGWSGTVSSSDPAYGSTRYYRWRMYFPTDNTFQGISWSDGGQGNLVNKLLVIGQGCGSDSCRFIMNHAGERGTGRIQFRLCKDGGEDQVETNYELPRGTWFNLQLEIKASSGQGRADGSYKLWINNNTYSSPTVRATNIVMHPWNHRYVMFGAYQNDGLQSGGVHRWLYTDFQVATSFDSGWNGGSTQTTAPIAPTNLRILTSN